MRINNSHKYIVFKGQKPNLSTEKNHLNSKSWQQQQQSKLNKTKQHRTLRNLPKYGSAAEKAAKESPKTSVLCTKIPKKNQKNNKNPFYNFKKPKLKFIKKTIFNYQLCLSGVWIRPQKMIQYQKGTKPISNPSW